MQGCKNYQEKLFLSFRLSDKVPKSNFYRRLKEVLDLSFIRRQTAKYYGKEGQKSIDSEIFFKLMLIGYLENLNSDRKIIEHASMRMDMLYFLGYDVDEELPWHSTLSRTRNLFGEEVFLNLFRKILSMCVEQGMVCGKRQAVDSAFIKANAAMDSLVERELCQDSSDYFHQLSGNSDSHREDKNTQPQSKKHSHKYVSTTDNDARVSQKQGKLPALNYLGQISVDTQSHIICGAMADFADKKDSDCTQAIVGQTVHSMNQNHITVEEVLADTGYSSGKSLRYLESVQITAYIPTHGSYKANREGFVYNAQEDCYICSQGKKVRFTGIKIDNGRTTTAREYHTRVEDCAGCPLKASCANKRGIKTITDSCDKVYYDRTYKRMKTSKGKKMSRLRAATVEPVIGTLLHFRGMKKVYTKGLSLANKHVLMAAMAYNIKKLLAHLSARSSAISINKIAAYLHNALYSEVLVCFVPACCLDKN